MRALTIFATMLLSLALFAAPARATVRIQVDLSSQTMHVTTGYGESYDWPVSTARFGYSTPRGTYGVQSLQAMHYSRKYHNSPMPHSIFFRGGYAIHGTYEVASLGRAASHGCVRLAPSNAAALYQMVRAEGATISIYGSAPAEVRYAGLRKRDRVRVAGRGRGGVRYVRLRATENPLAYAPAPAPQTYENWLQNPFGW